MTMSAAASEAWADSLLGEFAPQFAEGLLTGAWERTAEAGELFYRGGAASLVLIVGGLARTFLEADNGRRITLRYVRAGDLVGTAALLAPFSEEWSGQVSSAKGRHEVFAEAVRDTALLQLAPDRLEALARTEVSVASTLAVALARRTVESEQILTDGLFLSVRARIARHLMDLAERRDGSLMVTAGHQEIAEAIGSVREVVSRTLIKLGEEGVVSRIGRETRILDPAKLHAIGAGE